MIVHFDYMGPKDSDYKTIESKTYNITNNEDTYTFKYKFSKKGSYAVRANAIGIDGSEIWINDGYFFLK